MQESPDDTGGKRTTRRAFLMAVGSGLATVGVGVAAGAIISKSSPLDVFGARTTNSSDDPGLRGIVGTKADAAGSLNAFLTTASSWATITGQFFLDSPLIVPPNIRRLTLAPNSALKVRGDHSGIARSGSITLLEHTGFAISEGMSSFTTDSPNLYHPNDVVLLSGANTVPGSKDRYAYMRRVIGVNGKTVTVDSALPRTIDNAPRTSSVQLAPPLKIDGSGEVFNVDPHNAKKSLVTLFAVESPEIVGISVHSNGGIGITLSHCFGGSVDCTVRDLLDDGKNYFGYGVNVSGSTRDAYIRGYMTRVRHAVTTNPSSSIDGVGYVGEPENCTFAPTAEDCSNKAVDTHRLGWGITMIPNVRGGNSGCQVRADNVTIVGGTITGSSSGITVANVVSLAPNIRNVTISDISPGSGVKSIGPSIVSDCVFTNVSAPAILLRDHSTVSGINIIRSKGVGVLILGDSNQVSGVTSDSSTPSVKEASGTKNNDISK